MVLAKSFDDGDEEAKVDEAVREANKVERDALFRKEVISLLGPLRVVHLIDQAMQVDLTQTCLTTSPKSYGAWHHRAWALDLMARFTIN